MRQVNQSSNDFLSDFPRHFRGQGQVPFGVDLRHVGLAMAQGDLGGLQTKLLADLGGGRVPQPVRAPAGQASGLGPPLLHRILALLVRQINRPVDRPAVTARVVPISWVFLGLPFPVGPGPIPAR